MMSKCVPSVCPNYNNCKQIVLYLQMMGARDEEKVEILNDQKVEFLNEQEREEQEKEHEHWNGQVLSSSQVDEKDCENTPHTHKGSCCNHKSSSKPAPVPNANGFYRFRFLTSCYRT